MNSNAPGQLLGYVLQFPRALYHLLKSGPGDCVCVEVLGDVATMTTGGHVIAEEDKSSVVGNPLTDKSTDLWKTFSNWITAVNDGDLVVEKTRFILYCNKAGKISIVNSFSDAQNKNEAVLAIDNAKTILHDVTNDHEIWKYYDTAVNKNEPILQAIIERFELQIGVGTGYDEIRYELICKSVPVTQIDFMMDTIGGWLQRVILELIAAKKDALIRWDDYDHQFKVAYQRTRLRELVDFTLINPPGQPDIQQQVKIRPLYLKQLESIDATDEDIMEAVDDYLRAKVNLQKWIENEIIDADVASDFESKLSIFWNNRRKSIEITNKQISEVERGQLLYYDCKSRQESIRGESPPCSTIPGAYHSLANRPILGWHPEWKKPSSAQDEV